MSLSRIGLALVVVAAGWLGSARADGPAVLKYKFAKGDKLVYRQEEEMKQNQTVMNFKIDTTSHQEKIALQVVDAIDEQGNATLKTKTERRKLKIDGQQGKYEFDSKSTERDTTSEIGSKATGILERLTGSEYEVKLSPRGQVLEVNGFAELIADLVKDNPQATQFTGLSTDNSGAKLSEQDAYIQLSDKPVGPGDTWEVPVDIELAKVGKIRGKMVYTCEGEDKVGDRKTVRIGMSSELAIDLNIEAGGAKVTGTISTTSSQGTAQFDPQAGRVLSVKRNFSMAGQLTVDAGGMILTVDTNQEQSTTTTLLDKLPE